MQPVFASAGEFFLSLIAVAAVVGVCMGCGLLAGIAQCLSRLATNSASIEKHLAESVEIMRDNSDDWAEVCDDPDCDCHFDPTDIDDELRESGDGFGDDADFDTRKPPRK